jgi:hypothetical protein
MKVLALEPLGTGPSTVIGEERCQPSIQEKDETYEHPPDP